MRSSLFALLMLILVSLSLSAVAQDTKKALQLNADLRDALIEMGKGDQLYRGEIERLMKEMSGPNAKEAMKKLDVAMHNQDEIDRRNLAKLEQMIDKQGWPGESLVGREASRAAFLILQHAELSYQKRYFPLVKAAAEMKEAHPQDAAMLEDRIRVREGRKQIYGTQLSTDHKTNKLRLNPIEDEVNVDKRRAAVGLPPIAEYVKRFGLTYSPPKQD